MSSFIRSGARSLGALALAAAAAGCSEADRKVGADEGELKPGQAQNSYEMAAQCDQTLAVHAAVRPFDVADGSIRWKCGDVDGVTSFDKDGNPISDRGQEYCEYMAISSGRPIRQIEDATPGADGSPALQCFFTGVFRDNDPARDAALAAALADPANLGAPLPSPAVARMTKGFNSRGAAIQLISDCSNAAELPDEDRQTACYLASVENPAKAAELRAACAGVDLSDEAAWAKAQALGAKLLEPTDAGFERQRDVTGCVATKRAKGSTFRNSDPMICGRVFRAEEECGCGFNDLPDALEGFLMTGWASDRLPQGCRHAKVDGQDYPHLVVCDVPASEAADLQFQPEFSGDLQAFCNVRFGRDIAMRAPIRAVEQAGTCRRDTAFCAEFSPAPAAP
jgi:hypothetical protein